MRNFFRYEYVAMSDSACACTRPTLNSEDSPKVKALIPGTLGVGKINFTVAALLKSNIYSAIQRALIIPFGMSYSYTIRVIHTPKVW